METKTITDNLFNAIKMIRNNQKAQFTKVIDLEAKFKAFSDLIVSRLDRIDKSFDKEKDETGTTFDNVIDRFDKIGQVLILTV